MMAKLCLAFANWLRRHGKAIYIMRLGDDSGRVYLERYVILKTRFGGVYLHRFRQPDADEVHDHPWPSMSIILSGAYREYFHDGTHKVRSAPCVAVRGSMTMHRVELLKGLRPHDLQDLEEEMHRIDALPSPAQKYADGTFHAMARNPGCCIRAPLFCWTLFFFGRRSRKWGFATKHGWVPHEEFYTRHKQLHEEGVWGR